MIWYLAWWQRWLDGSLRNTDMGINQAGDVG